MPTFSLPSAPQYLAILLHCWTERSSTAYGSRRNRTPIASVDRFAPVIFGAQIHRPVSCYAFFKGWVLLSQPPGCLCARTSFTTERSLGTLANGLGSFPFDDGALPSPSHSRHQRAGIRSLSGFGRSKKTPAPKQSLYPPPCVTRLPLKAFRGEPAISGFDKFFAPIHRSSLGLVTPNGSGLHPAFAGLHPAYG